MPVFGPPISSGIGYPGALFDHYASVVQVMRHVARTLTAEVRIDEVLTDPDAGGVLTVTITEADGTVRTSNTPSTRVSVGTFAFPITPNVDLNVLDVVWRAQFSGFVCEPVRHKVEIVGDHYVSIASLRAMPDLSDTGKFPTVVLEEARRWFERKAEEYLGVAYVPRYGRDVLDGANGTELMVRKWPLRKILSVKVDGVAQTTTDWAVKSHGVIDRKTTGVFTTGSQNIAVAYEHGYDEPTEDLRQAAKVAIRSALLDRNSGNRTFATVTEFGIVRTSQPGPDRPFGIPEVDEILNQLRESVPALA